jgi:hypothetical protein
MAQRILKPGGRYAKQVQRIAGDRPTHVDGLAKDPSRGGIR